AVRRAAVAGRRVLVIAGFARAEDAVAADARHRADARPTAARPPRRDLADLGAAVAGGLVAVVALLAWIHRAVSAQRGVADLDAGDVRPRVRRADAAGAWTARGAATIVAGAALFHASTAA